MPRDLSSRQEEIKELIESYILDEQFGPPSIQAALKDMLTDVRHVADYLGLKGKEAWEESDNVFWEEYYSCDE